VTACAATHGLAHNQWLVVSVPIEFVLFAGTLLGVALWHRHALALAATGLLLVILFKLSSTGFAEGEGLPGLAAHLEHEWVILTNLGSLLLGFALLSRHFEQSHVPAALPRLLPAGAAGPFVLLVMVFVLSSFLDNIAAALIGGALARSLFPSVHVGFLAAVVAASNAGGSGSVVGDTTTTMMWIDGVAPREVFPAYVAAVTALMVSGFIGARQQHRHAPMHVPVVASVPIDWLRLVVVAAILVAAVIVNVTVNTRFAAVADRFPFLGATVWVVLIATAPLRAPDWMVLREAIKGTAFLLSLVLAASLMPVDQLPAASWQTTLGLGFVSAVFDNIPLTALALTQGGYDWGMLAYAVGYGGSMIWFGSSAGVAVSNLFPEARSAARWIAGGWHVAVAYLAGFLMLLTTLGWRPSVPH
jgi:Na+/H+ antiporter NhaD/arsenite permease-like protein